MSTKWKAGYGVFAAALAGSVTFATAANAAAAGSVVPAVVGATPIVQVPSRTVTLVTGDRVALTDDGQVTVQYNASRQNVTFTTYKKQGDVYVIPSDVQTMVLGGQVDSSLFDLTRLLAYGASTQSTDVIVQYAPGSAKTVGALATGKAGAAKITHQLPSVSAMAVRAPHATTAAFWSSLTTTSNHIAKLRSGVSKVWLDAVYKTSDQDSTPQVGAPTAWAAGFDGTGMKVGVVDTGIDATHPDLVGKVAASANFTTDPNANDNVGHGTHVASIIAGTGAASGGAQKGVAPGATLVSAKACTAAGCTESAIINAMQWAATQPGVKVVNMSLGGQPSGGTDPLDQAVNNLTASDHVLFVVAAGNSGPSYGTVESPGEADAALTVGAVDKSDAIASFSSRGPRFGDSAVKPDITAPGVAITGACSSTGTFCNPGDTYVQLSGTSMATPHVAGGAAIMAEAHPTWTPAQIKAALMAAANPNPSLDAFTQGAGRLDLARGYHQPVLADPPSVSFGRQNGPRSGYPTLTRTVTYSNTTSSAVTLSLNLAVTDPTGAPAPAGMFTLSASSVTVPANGQASVTITGVLSTAGPPNGRFSGYLTATSGTARVVTAVGDDQSLSYNVTSTVTGRTGGAATSFVIYYARTVGNGIEVFGIGGGGGQTSATLALPPGNYMVYANVTDVDAQGHQSLSILSYPQLAVNADQSISVDATTAGLVHTTVPDAAAVVQHTEVGAQFMPNGALGPSVSTGIPPSVTVYTGQLGPANTFVFGYMSKVVQELADPGPGGDVVNSPHVYRVGKLINQQMPTGVAQNETAATLANVTSTFAGQAGDTGFVGGFAQPNQPPNFGSSFTTSYPVSLPGQQTESYNTDNGVRWVTTMEDQDASGNDVNDLTSNLIAYTGGSTTTHVWNKPVIGPAFTTRVGPLDGIVRSGDFICPAGPLTGDSAGDAGNPGSPTSAGTVTLKLNGSVVGSEAYPGSLSFCYPVPSAWSAGYEIDAHLQRTSGVELSTTIDTQWTFSSASVDPNSVLPLQIWAATFAPALNSNNTAPANTSFQIPITALPQPGSAAAGLQTLTVDYSTNDGATWQSATVTTVNASTGSYRATVTHPNITGFVSLRAHITDLAGNTATQTILRAYKIAPGA